MLVQRSGVAQQDQRYRKIQEPQYNNYGTTKSDQEIAIKQTR